MNWLKGKKVALRALEPHDLENLYKWENCTEIWHVSDTIAPYSRYILQEYIEKAPKDIYENRQLRLIAETVDGDAAVAVGMVDLYDFDPYHNRAALGIYVDSSYQRSGLGCDVVEVIANYAFNYLHLKMLYCYIGADNERSIQFFKKCGFEVCGVIKDWLRGVNGYVDGYFLQLINPTSK
jgi:diamine N-acetyltransferase